MDTFNKIAAVQPRMGNQKTKLSRRGIGQRQLKINKTKKEKKQLLFVWSLLINDLSDLSDPIYQDH